MYLSLKKRKGLLPLRQELIRALIAVLENTYIGTYGCTYTLLCPLSSSFIEVVLFLICVMFVLSFQSTSLSTSDVIRL